MTFNSIITFIDFYILVYVIYGAQRSQMIRVFHFL